MSAVQQAEVPRPDHESAEVPRQVTWQEHQAAGDEAWNQVLEYTKDLQPVDDEGTVQLDETAIELYERVSYNLRMVILKGPEGPPDPFSLMKIGGSQAALAEVTPPGVFYDTGGRHIDVKSNLQESARQNLRRADAMLLGEEVQTEQPLDDEAPVVRRSGVMARAAIEAAKESGAPELGTTTPQSLEAEGADGTERFIWERSGAPGGLEFMRRLSAKAVTQLTEEHELPQRVRPQDREPLAA